MLACCPQAYKDKLPSNQVNPAMRLLRPVFGPLDAAIMFHDEAKQSLVTNADEQ